MALNADIDERKQKTETGEGIRETARLTPEDDETYAFVRETVRPRPLRFRAILLRVFSVTCAAVIFGAVAGYVFFELNLRREKAEGPKQVTIAQDQPITAAPQGTPTEVPTDSPEPTLTPTLTPSPAPEPKETTDPSQTQENLSPEEARALLLEEITEMSTALKSVAKDAGSFLVTLSTTVPSEDSLSETEHHVSGIILADNGESLLILADGADISAGEHIRCAFGNGQSYAVAYQARDPITQLTIYALPKAALEGEAAEAVQMAKLGNSYALENGDFLIAAGEPYGRSGSFLYGILHSANDLRAVTDGVYSLLLTDMEGMRSSNGVLLNSKGEVVGIIAQRYAPEGTDRITALPISPLKDLIEKLSNGAPIPYVGIVGTDVPETREDLPNGIYVDAVDADSPAMIAGIQPGDILTKVDNTEIPSLRAYRNKLMSRTPGEAVIFTVERPGAEEYVSFDFIVHINTLS